MGVKGLKSFLRSKFPYLLTQSHLSHYWGKKAALDLLPYLYKYKASYGETWKQGLFTLFSNCIQNNIHLTVIMDGPSTYQEKDKEREKRKEGRNKLHEKVIQLKSDLEQYETLGIITPLLDSISDKSSHRHLLLSTKKTISVEEVLEYIEKVKKQIVSIRPEDIKEVEMLCQSLSIQFIYARLEAESYSVYLCRSNQVDLVITEDTDVLAYGCPLWLSSLSHDGVCTEIDYSHLLQSMEYTSEQFLEFCILCGTDYNESIKGVGPVSAYHIIKKQSLLEYSKQSYEIIKNIFKNPCQEAIESKFDPVIKPITISFNFYRSIHLYPLEKNGYSVYSLSSYLKRYPYLFDIVS